MLGLPVLAALDGVVAAVIDNRLPYGNAVIIETPLDKLPPGWRAQLPMDIYDPAAPLQAPISLTCPAFDFHPPNQEVSLYTLYAHLQNPARLIVEDSLACGEEIGQVGTTGKSVNPHLHFETRLGPIRRHVHIDGAL